MATEVTLRACGGIGPYTWSSTGAVTLSATTGTQITVTASGSGGDPSVPGKACATGHYDYEYWQSGTCTGGATQHIRFILTAQNCLQCNGASASCLNFTVGSVTLTMTGGASCVDRENTNLNCVVTGGFSTFGLTQDITTVCSPSHSGPKDGSNVSVRVQYTPPAAGSSVDETVVLTQHAFAQSASGNLTSPFDIRTSSMVTAGCPSCTCDPTGSTVTVTDDAGISVTYTF